MDDVQIFHSRDEPERKKPGLIIFIVAALALIAIGVASSSYYLGKKISIDSFLREKQPSTAPTGEPDTPKEITASSPTTGPKPELTPGHTLTPAPSSRPILKTKILSATALLDGFRSSSGGGASNLEIRVGRDSSLVSRGFISFEISEIPSDAKVQNAELRLYQVKTSGNPYTSGGNLKLDHLTFGDALDKTDYALPALTTNFSIISESEKTGWKDADVTDKLKNDLANARSVSQYRIHFENELTDENSDGDFAYFESKENVLKTGNTPQLVVKYY